MTLFQSIFVPIFAISAAVSLAVAFRFRARRREGLTWTVVWTLGAVAIANPELTTRISRVFGIGRGVDFVIYLNLIAGIFVTLALYRRSRRLERMLTELLRERSLAEAERGSIGGEPTASFGPEERRDSPPAS